MDKQVLALDIDKNKYISVCNIRLYNIPKRKPNKKGYTYTISFNKVKIVNKKQDIKIKFKIPKDKIDDFVKYGISQTNSLNFCETTHYNKETFCVNIWLYLLEGKFINRQFHISDDEMHLHIMFKSPKIKKVKNKTRQFILDFNTDYENRIAENTQINNKFATFSTMDMRNRAKPANPFKPYQGGKWSPK